MNFNFRLPCILREEKDALKKWERALKVAAITNATSVAKLANFVVLQFAHVCDSAVSAARAARAARSAAQRRLTFPSDKKKAYAWASSVMKQGLLTKSGTSTSPPDLIKLVGNGGTPIFGARGILKLAQLKYPADYVLLHEWFAVHCPAALSSVTVK